VETAGSGGFTGEIFFAVLYKSAARSPLFVRRQLIPAFCPVKFMGVLWGLQADMSSIRGEFSEKMFIILSGAVSGQVPSKRLLWRAAARRGALPFRPAPGYTQCP
jgi:hypothetical protein